MEKLKYSEAHTAYTAFRLIVWISIDLMYMELVCFGPACLRCSIEYLSGVVSGKGEISYLCIEQLELEIHMSNRL